MKLRSAAFAVLLAGISVLAAPAIAQQDPQQLPAPPKISFHLQYDIGKNDATGLAIQKSFDGLLASNAKYFTITPGEPDVDSASDFQVTIATMFADENPKQDFVILLFTYHRVGQPLDVYIGQVDGIFAAKDDSYYDKLAAELLKDTVETIEQTQDSGALELGGQKQAVPILGSPVTSSPVRYKPGSTLLLQ